jgi:3-oxoacyl-[acyl-carrier protein] reductase
MMLSLIGKHALIGGASAGIGKATAIELARLGANVTLLARTETSLQTALAELDATQGQHHQYLVVDYKNRADLDAKVLQLVQQTPVHILVNNTGGPPGGPLTHAEPTALLEALQNHLLCNHLLAQAVLPGMKNAQYGRIINIISTSVKEPLDNLGVSNTTRWAVAGWSKTWANEAGPFGITVNNVLPGYTETGRLTEIIEKRAAASQISPEEVAQQFKSHVPLRRFAQPAEIAAAVAFLASPAASYINGINLPVDGGRTKSL